MSCWNDAHWFRTSILLLALLVTLSACSSDNPESALPAGIVLYQRSPDFASIERSPTSHLDESEVWGDGTWTKARISPNGTLVLAFGPDDRATLLTTEGETISGLDPRMYCPSFASDREIISLTRPKVSDDGKATLLKWLIIGTGKDSSVADPVVLGEYTNFAECPVVAGELIAYTDDLGVVLIDGNETRRLPSGGGCTAITFPAGVDEEVLPFVVGCQTAEDSGLFTYAVNTREITQIIGGFVAAPSYSPDGQWLLFGRPRDECCEPIDVWIAAADGSNQRLLVENASWPNFIPTPGA